MLPSWIRNVTIELLEGLAFREQLISLLTSPSLCVTGPYACSAVRYLWRLWLHGVQAIFQPSGMISLFFAPCGKAASGSLLANLCSVTDSFNLERETRGFAADGTTQARIMNVPGAIAQ
jgi:hypothetical protein